MIFGFVASSARCQYQRGRCESSKSERAFASDHYEGSYPNRLTYISSPAQPESGMIETLFPDSGALSNMS